MKGADQGEETGTRAGEAARYSLLVVDPAISRKNPSQYSFLGALQEIEGRGADVSFWTWSIDDQFARRRFRILPGGRAPGLLRGAIFSLICRMAMGWEFGILRRPRPDVILSVDDRLLFPDVATLHFPHWRWVRLQRQVAPGGLKSWLTGLFFRYHGWRCHRLYRSRSTRLLLPVSDGLAAYVREAGATVPVEVLANVWDREAFNPEVRESWRGRARRQYGISEEATVFVFLSAGHYDRKGFFLAARALALLRERGLPVVFLVIGGKPATLEMLRERLAEIAPGSEDWLLLAGSVERPAEALSAGDALLFPSYCEAFSLAEIEAAGLGLRLYLTPHEGSEMVLADGVNGRLLPWEPEAMADLLAEEIASGAAKPNRLRPRGALSENAYAERFDMLVRMFCLGKEAPKP